MANIIDVANRCNVSVATVSRVLNGSNKVTEKTKEKVLKAIDELHYHPNLLGRNLRTNRTNMILVMLPSISNSFYSRLVAGITDCGAEYGLNTMICTTDNDIEKEKTYLELMRNNFADGIIHLSIPPEDKHTISLCERYAFVQCSEYSESIKAPYISVDNRKAAYDATEHLIKMGYKKIALLMGKDKVSTTVTRREGFVKAMEDNGMPTPDEYFMKGNYDYGKSYRLISEILKSANPPDAVFAMSDVMAMAAANAAIDCGLNIPQDFGIVGFDNIAFVDSFRPELTSIAQPCYEMGRAALKMVVDRIEGNKTGNILLEHDLVVRKSSARK